MKKKLCKKLTKAEKEIVYSKPESNAGAGWGDPIDDYRATLAEGGIAMRKKKAIET